MARKLRRYLAATLFALAALRGDSQQLAITNLGLSSNAVWLGWTSPTDRYIIAQSPSMATGHFQYVGAVLSTNAGTLTLTNDAVSAFFRLRQVAVVCFPDPNLALVVSNAITTWYEPHGLFYDIEVEDIARLTASRSGITNAEGLNALCALTQLDISVNPLTALNVSDYPALQWLECTDGALTNLSVSGCSSLTFVTCEANQLPSLDLSALGDLRSVSCSRNQLTNLDLSGCLGLEELNCFSNLLTSLDLSSCSNLYLVNVAYNELTDLNVSVCPGLVALLCSYNQLAALSMSGFGELRYVNCRSNRIAALDLSGCTQLTYLDCRTNELTDLSSLVTNALQGGLGAGDQVYLSGNPLSDFAVTSQIPYLQSRGVTVFWP